MFFGIFLLERGRQQIIFGIIIDHGFGQYFVALRVSGGIFQLLVHKGGDLIHIQINVGNILQLDVLYSA